MRGPKDAKEFRAWLSQFSALTPSQRERLKGVLKAEEADRSAQDMVNRRSSEVLCCPHCRAGRIRRWGKEGGIQRYRCGICRKTFNALTGTPLARLQRREAWLAFYREMLKGGSLRQAARGCGIHLATAHRWRHRVLQRLAQENETELTGIVEADETYFLESFKGSRHLPRPARHRGGRALRRGISREQMPVRVVQDRHGKHFDSVLPKADKATLGGLLPQLLAPDAVLCTDGAGVYRAVAKAQGIAHEPLNHAQGTRVKQRVFHIQHVNAYDARLKEWMRRFHFSRHPIFAQLFGMAASAGTLR